MKEINQKLNEGIELEKKEVPVKLPFELSQIGRFSPQNYVFLKRILSLTTQDILFGVDALSNGD